MVDGDEADDHDAHLELVFCAERCQSPAQLKSIDGGSYADAAPIPWPRPDSETIKLADGMRERSVRRLRSFQSLQHDNHRRTAGGTSRIGGRPFVDKNRLRKRVTREKPRRGRVIMRLGAAMLSQPGTHRLRGGASRPQPNCKGRLREPTGSDHAGECGR
jgi:hypothetical protein